jgi:hypothetical protein
MTHDGANRRQGSKGPGSRISKGSAGHKACATAGTLSIHCERKKGPVASSKAGFDRRSAAIEPTAAKLTRSASPEVIPANLGSEPRMHAARRTGDRSSNAEDREAQRPKGSRSGRERSSLLPLSSPANAQANARQQRSRSFGSARSQRACWRKLAGTKRSQSRKEAAVRAIQQWNVTAQRRAMHGSAKPGVRERTRRSAKRQRHASGRSNSAVSVTQAHGPLEHVAATMGQNP